MAAAEMMDQAENASAGLISQGKKAFAHAVAQLGISQGCFRLGTEILQIRAAGSAMFFAVSAAWCHLRVEDRSEPDLILHVWENDSTADFQLRPADALSDGQSVALRQRAEDGGSLCMARVDDGILYVSDFSRRVAYCCIMSLNHWPSWEAAAPFRPLMNAWLGQKGFLLAHASCVGIGDRSLLLAGPGGSGKSTTALVCARDGWTHYADDFTLIQPGAAPSVFPFYNKAKIRPDTLDFFPEWGERRDPDIPVEEKTVIPLAEMHEASIGKESCPLTALVFPTVRFAKTLAEPCLKELDRREALLLLAPSSVLQLPTGGARAFSGLAALVRQLPCWQLQLTPDTTRVSVLLRELISSTP